MRFTQLRGEVVHESNRDAIMLKELGVIGGIGIVAGLSALYWIQPDTAGGQTLLFIVVFAVVSGLLETIAVLLKLVKRAQ